MLEPWRSREDSPLIEHLIDVRRQIHRFPELAFEETRTSDLVARWLAHHGLEVHRGLAGTGVVGTLRRGKSERAIGLRADMDALPMEEMNSFAHRSMHPGKFHGCGHDGHTAMLLGAAARLSKQRDFDGIVHFVFQPAEESAGGAEVMIRDGLFTKFPMQAIYGLHNYPSLPLGRFHGRTGAFLAAYGEIDITLHGTGGHAGLPQLARDPVPAAAALIQAAQTIVSRSVHPLAPAVLSLTRVKAGDAYNVIPQSVTVGGSYRYFDADAGTLLVKRLTELSHGVAAAHGCRADVTCRTKYPPVVNTEREVTLALEAARAVAGNDQSSATANLIMGSEDFAFMLQEVPGAYLLLGAGEGAEVCSVHNPRYDFNDALIPLGVDWWVEVVRRELPVLTHYATE